MFLSLCAVRLTIGERFKGGNLLLQVIMGSLPKIDLVKELKELFKQGYVKSLRSSDTGIGYTLEALLKIKENNRGEPDFEYNGLLVELKTQRENAGSKVTLMTKTPNWNPLKPKEIIESSLCFLSPSHNTFLYSLLFKNFTSYLLELFLKANIYRGSCGILVPSGASIPQSSNDHF